MSTTIHICADIEGLLRSRNLAGIGPPGVPKSKVRAELKRLLASGAKLIPSVGCDNFDPEKGCRGHRDVEPRCSSDVEQPPAAVVRADLESLAPMPPPAGGCEPWTGAPDCPPFAPLVLPPDAIATFQRLGGDAGAGAGHRVRATAGLADPPAGVVADLRDVLTRLLALRVLSVEAELLYHRDREVVARAQALLDEVSR